MKSLLLIFSQECCFNIRKDQVHLKHVELDELMLFYIILIYYYQANSIFVLSKIYCEKRMISVNVDITLMARFIFAIQSFEILKCVLIYINCSFVQNIYYVLLKK